MEHLEKVNLVYTRDFPAFIAKLEKKYGVEWVRANIGATLSVLENPAVGTNFFAANGNEASLLRCCHGVLQGMMANIVRAKPEVTLADALRHLFKLLWNNIAGDLGRQGVPDSIFDAYMKSKNEEGGEATENPEFPTPAA